MTALPAVREAGRVRATRSYTAARRALRHAPPSGGHLNDGPLE
jgi:hypothetical protein